jgi:hypothetical protein
LNVLGGLENIRIANDLKKENLITAIRSIWESRNALFAMKNDDIMYIVSDTDAFSAIPNARTLGPRFTPKDVVII